MIPPMDLQPATLHGDIVTLEPRTMAQLDGLAAAASDDEIWSFLDEETPDRDGMAGLFAEARDEQAAGARIPLRHHRTRFLSGHQQHQLHRHPTQTPRRRNRLGLAHPWPLETGAAREASQLLIAHAFDTAGAIRIAFKTDSRNTRSQRAIEAHGANRKVSFATTASCATASSASRSTTAFCLKQ